MLAFWLGLAPPPYILYAKFMSTPQERKDWIFYYEREGCPKVDVCRRFKISRPTFDKWLKRWRRGHQARSLEEKSRTPKRSPRMLSRELQTQIRYLRGQLSKRKAVQLIAGEGVRITKREVAGFRINPYLLYEINWGRPSLKNRTSYRKIHKILQDDWFIQRTRKVPSIHAIENACSRRGKKYNRKKKSTRGPA